MQNYHQNNCGCRQTTDYGRYSSTQYVSRPQATPCCDREDSLDGMPLAMAYCSMADLAAHLRGRKRILPGNHI